MPDMLDVGAIRQDIGKYSDKSLLIIETRLQNRIAALQKCVPWPALIHSLSGDLEVVWTEQKRRFIGKHKKKMEDSALFVNRLVDQSKQSNDKR